MSCEHFEEIIVTSVDLELSSVQQGDLDRHLGGCDSCRQLLEDLREDSELLGQPAPWQEADLEAIRRSVLEEVAVEPAGRLPRWLPWAALLLLAVGLGWLGRLASVTDTAPPMRIARHAPWSEPTLNVSADSIVPRNLKLAFPPVLEAEPTTIPASISRPEPAALSESRDLRETTEATESMVIQLVSTDPDLVIYWLIDSKEDRDATSTS